MSETKALAALIGAGMVAKTHIAACLDLHEKLKLKTIVSRSGDRAQILAEEATTKSGQDIKVTSSINDICHDTEIDFAIIATPPNARLSLIEPLAKAGKHILLEKPIGRNAKEAKEIIACCKQAGVSLGIVFQHRARSASLHARDLIKTGRYGKLGLVEMNVPWWREQSYYDEPERGTYARDGGGVLISQAIHTMDLALSLTGPVSSVQAMSKTTLFHEMESEDYVVAGLEFANGAIGSLVASTASYPGDTESIILHFEKASLMLKSGQLQVTHRDGEIEIFGNKASTGGGADPMAFTHDWHQSIIENFIDVIQKNVPPLASGEDGLLVHELIDAITRSAKSGAKEYLNI